MIRRLFDALRVFVTNEQGATILAQHAGHADVHDILLVLGLALFALLGSHRKG
jgi:hypothetical protein